LILFFCELQVLQKPRHTSIAYEQESMQASECLL
jgi:hypothetical protein